mmetsp:Transcript_68213/g.110703  ORF Transcript_68213/g.110703 Transcript_68213/m.110703 type:complete len:218 (+) Transcript_68213:181-834(+)
MLGLEETSDVRFKFFVHTIPGSFRFHGFHQLFKARQIRAARELDLTKPVAKSFRVLETYSLSLVVLKVVVRVAFLFHKRKPKHRCMIKIVCNCQNRVSSPDIVVATDVGREAVGRDHLARHGRVLRVKGAPCALLHGETLVLCVAQRRNVIGEARDGVHVGVVEPQTRVDDDFALLFLAAEDGLGVGPTLIHGESTWVEFYLALVLEELAHVEPVCV